MNYELHLGDNREVLRSMPSDSVDSIVCDPPYELGFMGKRWDSTGIAYDVTLWAHRRVWRKHHGAVPVGFFIHHINGDKQDNRIENLQLVDALTHKRIHSGCEFRDGQWFKPCKKCGEFKSVDSEYYKRKDGISPWCRQCCIDNAVANKRKRATAKKQQS